MTTDQEVVSIDDVNHRLSRLQVSKTGTRGDTEVSAVSSPTSLDDELRTWLDSAADTASPNVGPSPRVYAKILVSNAAAGSIIGKAGTNINNFQQQTFARMQLSKAEEYFPGTTERTLLVTGTLKQVVAALNLVLGKLLKEGVAPISPRYKASLPDNKTPDNLEGSDHSAITSESARLMIKLLVPQPLCGIVIGKSGSNVKQTAEKTSTHIRMINSEGLRLPLTHNVFVISGQTEGILKAIALMMLKQCQDLKYQSFSELHSSYLTAPMMAAHHDTMGMMQQGAYYIPYTTHPGMVQSGHAPVMYDPAMASSGAAAAEGAVSGGSFYSLPVVLTDQQVGLLGSRAGTAVIEQAEQMTGTRIRLHRESRTLAISGPVEGVQMAHYMLSQRLAIMTMQQQAYTQQPSQQPQQRQGGYYSNGSSSGYGRYQTGSRYGGGEKMMENGRHD